MNNSSHHIFQKIIETQHCRDKCFNVLKDIVEEHTKQKDQLRLSLKLEDLIGKMYIFNRPFKHGQMKSLLPKKLQQANNLFTQEKNGQLKLLDYYTGADVFDFIGIQNFLQKFHDITLLKEDNEDNFNNFFNENFHYLVLWARDFDSENYLENTNFNNFTNLYEFYIIQI